MLIYVHFYLSSYHLQQFVGLTTSQSDELYRDFNSLKLTASLLTYTQGLASEGIQGEETAYLNTSFL